MSKILTQVIQAQGKELLCQPQVLQESLLQAGMSAAEAAQIAFILTACPSVGAVLAQGEEKLTEPEAQSAIAAMSRATGLSAAICRRQFSEMAKAAGRGSTGNVRDYLRFAPGACRSSAGTGAVSDNEVELLWQAVDGLQDENTEALSLQQLTEIANAGSGVASYQLGEYYRNQKQDNARALSWYRRSAAQGYGPGNGGSASMLLEGKLPLGGLSDRYFAQPGALTGTDGKTWTDLGARLLDYRRLNKKRAWFCLILCAVALILSILTLQISGLWGTLALICVVLATLCDCFVLFVSPCTTLLPAWVQLLLGWIFALIAMLG